MAIKVQGSTIIDDSRVLINTGNVGVGTTNPDTAVDSGNTGIVHAGIVTANKFYGDGSNLTGITAGQVGALAGFTVREEGSTVGTVGSVGDINFVSSNLSATASGVGATITLSDTPEFDNLNVSGISTFGGAIDLNSSNTNFNDGIKVGRYITGQSGQRLTITNQSNGILLEGGGGASINLAAGAITLGTGTNGPLTIYPSNWTIFNSPTITLDGSNKFANIVGKVGLGSAIPSEKLDVAGTIKTQHLNVTGISTFNSDVRITSTGNLILDASGPQSVIFKDGGSDGLQFSYFTNGDTLNLQRSSDGFKVLLANRDSANIELYNNNSKKLETTGIGISVVNGTSDTATITGPSNLIIDPVVVGDNTGSVRIKGDLFVDGTTTQINSTTLEIADFVVGIASTATTDLLTDGAGIQIGPDNTFLYEHNGGTNPSLKSSENLNVAAGKGYQVNQVDVLNATTLGSGVTVSSLTSVGTLNGLSVDGDLSITNKIIHSGDTNTAIRFPVNDTIRLITSGSPRLDVTPNGYILLGTTSEPNGGDAHAQNAKLLVQGRVGNAADSGRINLQRGSSASNDSSIGSINFTDNSNNAFSRIETFADAAPGNSSFPGRITFSTTNDGASTPTEKLRITSDGKVGIGTDNPQEKLHVSGTSDFVVDTDTSTLRFGSYGEYDIALVTGRNSPDGSSRLYIENGNGEEIRITSDGKVGIGTTNPKSTLDVQGDIHFNNNVLIASSGASNNIDHIWHDDNSSFGTGGTWNFVSDGTKRSTGNSAIQIGYLKSSGGGHFLDSVGIGTNNPAYSLDLGKTASTIRLVSENNGTAIRMGAGGSANDVTLIRVDGDNQNSSFYGESNSSRFGFSIKYMGSRSGNNNSLSIFSDNQQGTQVEAVTILQDGKVGIGTDNPGSKLHLSGIGTQTIRVDTAGTALSIHDHSEFIGFIGNDAGKLFINAGGTEDTLSLRTNGTERLRITRAGRVGIVTDNPLQKLTVYNESANANGGILVQNVTYASNEDRPYLIVGTKGWTGDTTNWNTFGFQHRIKSNSGGTARITVDSTGGELLSITSGGNIGIGITNPDKTLVVKGANSEIVINDTNGSPTLRFRNNGTTGGTIDLSSTNDLLFKAGGTTERLRITSDGDITTLSSGITTQTSNAFYENNRRVLEVHGGATQGWLALGATRTDTDAYVGGINFINRHGQIDNHRFLGYIRLKSTHVSTNQYGTNVLKGQLEFATKPSGAGISTTTPDMVISPAGNVGIGTDNPDTLLNLFGIGNTTIKVHNKEATPGTYSRLQFITGGPGSSARSEIRSLRMSTASAATNLAFFTTASGDTSPTERLRIDSGGQVGIGTNNPTASLEIHSVTNGANSPFKVLHSLGNEYFRISHNGNVGIRSDDPGERLVVHGKIRIEDDSPSPGLLIRDTDASGDIGIYQYNSGDLQILNNATSRNIVFQTHNGTSVGERLRIASDGKVGIGTNDPLGTVHISSGTSGDATLILEADTDNNQEGDNPYIVFRQDGGVNASAIGHGVDSGVDGNGLTIANSISSGFISFATGSSNGYTNATERLRIGSAGQIGLGGANYGTSGQVLTSNGANSAPTWQDASGGSGSGDKISEGNTEAEVVDNGSDGHFKVTTEGTERLRVTSGGSVGIGTTNTTANSLLQLQSTSTNQNVLRISANNGRTANIKSPIDSDLNTPFTFFTNNSWGFDVDSNRILTLSSDYKVGIRTDAPISPLDILLDAGAGDPRIRFDVTSGDDPFIEWNRWTGNGTSYYGIRAKSRLGDLALEFANNATTIGSHSYTERLRITSGGNVTISDGNVAIGTDSPGTKLEVAGTGSPAIRIRDLDGDNQFAQIVSNNGLILIDSRNGNSDGQIVFRGRDNTGTNEYGRFDEVGRFGVGIANPNSNLHVKGGSDSTDNLLLTLQSNGVANDGTLSTGLRLINSTSDTSIHGADIRAIRTSASTADLTFSLYNSGNSPTERLRITSDGKVGINSTSPETGLDILSDDGILVRTVSNAPTNGARIQFSDRGSGDQRGHIIYRHSDNSVSPGSQDGFLIGGNQSPTVVRVEGRALIDGKVGIGTDNPDSKLEVQDSSSTGIIVRCTSTQSTNTNKALRVRNNSDTNTFSVSHKGQGYFASEVGIGTDNPLSPFDIAVTSGSGNPRIRFDETQDDPFIELNRWTGTGTDYYGIRSRSRGGDLALEFANSTTTVGSHSYTEVLRITSDGNVGIGTDDPLQKLFVESSVIPVTIKRTTDAGDLIYLRNNNYYNVIGGDNGSLYFKTNGTAGGDERLRITSDGKFGFGTNNPQGTVHISSGTSGDATLILEADTDNNNEADNPNILFRQDGGLDLGAIGMNLTNSSSIGPSNELYLAASSGDAAIVFATGTTNGYTNATEKLRITGVGTVRIPDNGKFTAGANDDLQIYHSPNDSYIDNTSGSLYIRGANGNHIRIQAKSGEESIVAAANGTVELYYDNTPRLQTTNVGVGITGLLIASSGINAKGAIEFDSTLETYNPSGGSGSDSATDVAIALPSGKRIIGYDDGYIRNLLSWSNASDIIIGQQNTSKIQGIQLKPGSNAGVGLHYAGDADNLKLETIGAGVTVTGTTFSNQLNVSGVSTLSGNVVASDTLTVGDPSFITGGAPADQGVLSVYGTGKNALIIQTTNNSNSRGIAFRNSGDAYVGYISMENRGNSDADMVFGVDNSNSSTVGAVEERLRITKDGNVGIGTDDPTGKLQVGSATGSHVIITENTGIDINDGAINLYQATTNVNAAPFIISTDVGGTETEKLRVTGAGNVGIASATPAARLDVYKDFGGIGAGIYAGRIYGTDTGVDETGVRFVTKGTGDLHNVSDAYLMHGISNGTTRFVFGANGKVGINSTSPETGLDIRSDDGIFVRTVTNGGTSSTGGAKIQFSDQTSATQRGHIIYRHPDNSVSPGSNDGFLIGGTENTSVVRVEGRAIIDEKVGVGTDDPTATLHVRGTQNAGGILVEDSSTSTQAPAIKVIGKRSDSNIHHSFSGKLLLAKNQTNAKIQGNDSILGTVAFGGNHTDATMSNILYAASIHGVAEDTFDSATDMPTALVFRTGTTGRSGNTNNVQIGTERLRIKNDGDISIPGNAGDKTIFYGDGSTVGYFQSRTNVNRSGSGQAIHIQDYRWNNTAVARTRALTGDDAVNKDNGVLTFETNSGSGLTERVRISENGNVGISTTVAESALDVGIGTITTRGSVDMRASDSTTQKFSMLYNETTDSLDFVYTA